MVASISTTLIRTVGSLADLGRSSANRRCHLLCTLRLFEGWLSLLRPGPPPKLLRNKEYEALRRAYGVDMLLLDPKAVVTATMVLERTDGKSERLYCTVSASEVVKSHPGHHLSSSPPL
uniref:Uncharacterized protein n=1 Tax=Brassica oleracea var. oleracea TaxID=109376 RepID=A0A0D3A5D6_BRAOL